MDGAKIIPVPVENGDVLPNHRAHPISSSANTGLLSIPAVLRSLREQGIQSLMVEGGARVIHGFLRTASSSSGAMVDTVIITVAPQLVGERGTAYSLSEVCLIDITFPR
jgi:riboflavin biosynthesis pyrimidine reductase